ncbi:hypothetical protein SEA_INTOLERANT_12 [Streptomyces phage Intolerant]|nr:hypothetical protein SEA_INTOLERANT_12 [Streptomyces phage Intolerant]
MTAKLSFKTTQTAFGKVYDMLVTDTVKGTEKHYNLLTARPVSEYLKWIGPAYLAENGTAFRIGRNVAGGMVAWKSVKISDRFGKGGYRMRSVPGGYKGDYVTHWSRNINGKTFDFSRIYWNAGKDGSSLIVRRLGQDVHRWDSKTPVKMKTGFSGK